MKSPLHHAAQKASELMSCCIEYISKLGKLVFKSLAASKCRRSISSVAAILRLGGGYLVLPGQSSQLDLEISFTLGTQQIHHYSSIALVITLNCHWQGRGQSGSPTHFHKKSDGEPVQVQGCGLRQIGVTCSARSQYCLFSGNSLTTHSLNKWSKFYSTGTRFDIATLYIKFIVNKLD